METKNYKLTLNMPKTDFPMKADLVNKEIQYRKKWNETKIYKQVLEKNKNKKPFILHDGPPYANGSLHAGHALNKILKDIIIRYKSINNFYTPFIPGWDTHGLPIENKILSQMKINHKQISILELRQKASLYAQEQIEIQKKQFLQLQLLSDFSKIYKTLDKDFEVKQLKVFKKMCLDGLIYKGLKPVYWSCSSQSALADAEVEYYDHVSPSIFVKFPIKKANHIVKENDYLVIWTTTPWTLIANSAIAVNKNFDYSLIEYQNQRYIVAHQLIDQLSKTFQWNDDFKIVNTFKGEQLIGIEYQSIINKNDCLVVEGHHINLDSGSGLVHIAPLFGEDDFLIGKKNNLKMIMHVEDDGTINEQGFEYKGLFYEDANKEIGKFLEENNYLLKLNFIKHQYPHDWRTKKPIIFRGTPQWFVSISKIKSQILKELKDVKFYSNWGYKRLFNMIENRDDWTISRQRIWGVPIIVFYDENKNPVIDEQIFDHVINLIEKHGSNIWYEKDCDQLLPEKYRNKNWTKENDIMDVWFDSGTSFLGVKFDENIEAPYDLYFEGNDQYRGWFNSSLINSVAYLNKAPFKELLSHGFVVDEKGRKMSKSANNGIDPLEIVNNYGAEILRLWASNSEYSNDISISQNIINQNSELYRKIRNTIRFLLSNLYDYQYEEIELDGVNLLIQERLENLKIKVKKNYEDYQFINVIKDINNFIIDLSSFYLSITKDILYVQKPTDNSRKQVQFIFYKLLDFLLISLYPIIPTTSEEAYSFFENKKNKKDSICLEQFYSVKENEVFDEENKWKEFFEIKDRIYKLIENEIKLGLIKRTNEALVYIKTDSEFIKSLDLKMLLMVGKIEFSNEDKVEKFVSQKCLRCWNHFEEDQIKNDLCLKCDSIINV